MCELHYQPSYFFDEMEMYELDLILSNYQYHYKNEMEMNRNISYIIAQCNSSKKLKPQDIIKFPWDNEDVKKESKQLTEADLQLFRNKAKQIIQKNFLIK